MEKTNVAGAEKRAVKATPQSDIAIEGRSRPWLWSAVRILSCVLSISWVFLIHVSLAIGGFPPASRWGNVRLILLTLVTILAMFPILCFMRGRMFYLVALPFLVLASLTVCPLIIELWRSHF